MLNAQIMVQGDGCVDEGFMRELLPIDFSDPWPTTYDTPAMGDHFPAAPPQFIESHDKKPLDGFSQWRAFSSAR